MLSIALMNAVHETVDQTTLHSPIIDQIAAQWLTTPVTLSSARASANFTFVVETPEKRQVVLRFNLVTNRPMERIRSELALIRQLAQKGIRTASPLHSLKGNLVERVPTQLGVFHAVAFDVLSGNHFEFDSLDLAGFGAWGKALAQLHSASENLVIENRPSWKTHIQMVKEIVPRSEQWLWTDLAALDQTFNQLRVDPTRFGLIHYDFELDNILWDQGKPGIVDLDDSAYYWFVADVAIALRKLFDNRVERIDLKDERFRAFIAGYRSMRQIEMQDLKLIPLFLRFHNLVTYARVYRAIAVDVQEHESEFLIELRRELGERLAQYRFDVEMHPIGPFYRTWSAQFV